MNSINRKTYLALLRNDVFCFIDRAFSYLNPGTEFLPNWHLQAIAWHLQQCALGQIKRLIITLPPRSLKSHCASIAFPVWCMGRDPTLRVIAASYSNDLSSKFSRESRKLMEAPWVKECFPHLHINPKKCTEQVIETTQHGHRFSTSVSGALTGLGGNFLIVDDSLKPDDAYSDVRRNGVNDWFDGTLMSRLDNKKEDVIVIVQQRVHCEDLVGHLIETGDEWVHLNLPAIAAEDQIIEVGERQTHARKAGEVLHPEREPLEVLEQIKKQMGSLLFSTQYLQNPIPMDGNIVKRSWLQTYKKVPSTPFQQVVQSWDVATTTTGDYSACTTWGISKSKNYLLDVWRGKLEYPALKSKVIALAGQYDANTVLIEKPGIGLSLAQDLKSSLHRSKVIMMDPKGDKLDRLIGVTSMIEAGDVLFPEEALWLATFLEELLGFPLAKYDDQVDSVSQFLEWIRKRGLHVDLIPAAPRIIPFQD